MIRTADADILARIRQIELRARGVVETYLAGMHRSLRQGFAVEFAQHREYTPGDDIKHLDWKVYARAERYYLKQYELETQLTGYVVVDGSESMAYTSATLSKYDHACTAALAFSYLMVQQSDAIGVAWFDEQLRHVLPPGSRPSHLKEVGRLLAGKPGGQKTQTGAILHQLAERLPRRGVVMIFSDAFDDLEMIKSGLKHLRHAGHEMVWFHTLDAAELDFPFQQSTLFRGLEQETDLLTDPRGIRDAYLTEFNAFCTQLERMCRDLRCDYVLLRSDRDLGRTLAQYLSQRAGR